MTAVNVESRASLHPRLVEPRREALIAKRCVDFTVALVLLVLLSPLLLAASLAIRLTSRGPILYRQKRMGQVGQPFDMLKFRTMREVRYQLAFRVGSGSAPGGVEGLDRRTPVGRLLRRTAIDELPQLINVLRGDMSLVGPRPERIEFVRVFNEQVSGYAARHRMPVGMTGLSQVSGLRGQTSIDERTRCDLEYVARWSLWLDLRILLRTIATVARGVE